MRYVRRVHRTHSKVPDLLEKLEFAEEDTITSKGENFLLFDSGPGKGRTLIFATNSNLQFLADNRNWAADRTFKVVPILFYQLYTIHALVENKSYACVFNLMSKKTKQAYKDVFKVLKEKKAGFVEP
ncbi:hypothetical protein DMENIID0001_061870 [Sergentomyia squamirostris]